MTLAGQSLEVKLEDQDADYRTCHYNGRKLDFVNTGLRVQTLLMRIITISSLFA
jgi:hypothetical protein